MKYTRYQDIPKFITEGDYSVHFTPDRLVATIDAMVANEGLVIDPDFQRGHVWTRAQQIAFVAFFLRGGRSGRTIYLNCPNYQHGNTPKPGAFVLVDGKQRLEAWRAFFKNEFEVFGSFAREFTDSLRLVAQTMTLNINELRTRREVLQWYIDMNAGGTPHSDAEIAKVRALIDQET